ncbi:unnamed protein product, partial [Trichogramma brassicae]
MCLPMHTRWRTRASPSTTTTTPARNRELVLGALSTCAAARKVILILMTIFEWEQRKLTYNEQKRKQFIHNIRSPIITLIIEHKKPYASDVLADDRVHLEDEGTRHLALYIFYKSSSFTPAFCIMHDIKYEPSSRLLIEIRKFLDVLQVYESVTKLKFYNFNSDIRSRSWRQMRRVLQYDTLVDVRAATPTTSEGSFGRSFFWSIRCENYFEIFESYKKLSTKIAPNRRFILVSGALAVVEKIENRGYQLKRSDALTIMKCFADFELFEKSSDLEKSWYDDEKFITRAKEIWICPAFQTCKLNFIHTLSFNVGEMRRINMGFKFIFVFKCLAASIACINDAFINITECNLILENNAIQGKPTRPPRVNDVDTDLIGFLIATLYCFMNNEVKTEIARAWNNWRSKKEIYCKHCKRLRERRNVAKKNERSGSSSGGNGNGNSSDKSESLTLSLINN